MKKKLLICLMTIMFLAMITGLFVLLLIDESILPKEVVLWYLGGCAIGEVMFMVCWLFRRHAMMD